jgi:phosphate/sulfate permease
MKKACRLCLFGFMSWLLTFAASFCLFPIKIGDERLFEMLMGLILTVCTALFTLLYFRPVRTAFAREGGLLGVAFLACNILFDLPMFMVGPMQMPLLSYLKQIGMAYLSMPVISIAFGCALQKLQREI